MTTFPALVLAVFIPLLFLNVVRKYDFYQTGQYNTIFLSLVFGGIAYVLAALTNQIPFYFELLDGEIIEQYVAPVSEEILKGLFLVYLLRHRNFTYSVDGALYGFAIGIGFAVIENYFYIMGKPSIAIGIALQRVFTTNLVHAFCSATIGIALGMFLLDTSRLRWWIPVFGLILAISQHMLYNNIIHMTDIVGIKMHPLITVIPGLPGIIFIGYVMQRGVKQAQTWIKDKLEMEDRITRNEVSAVNSLATTDEVLLPVIKRFGAEKASQVEKLLYLQARIGIKRKSLDSLQNNDKMRSAIETEIHKMREEMDEIRQSIGMYAMLFVRGLFTDEMISVWDQIQAKIRERSAASGGQKGGGLWSSLDERVQ